MQGTGAGSQGTVHDWYGGMHTGLQSSSQTYCISEGGSFRTVRHFP